DLLPDFFQFEAEVHEDLRGDSIVFPQKSKQKMFRAYVVVVEVPSFLDGILDDFLRSRRLRQLAHGDHVRAALDELFDLEANFAQIDVEVLQDVSADA